MWSLIMLSFAYYLKNFQKPFHLITIKWNSFNVITNNVIICFLFSILQRPLDLISTSQPPIKYLWVMLYEIVLLILITLSSFLYIIFISNWVKRKKKSEFFHFSFSLFESEVRIINMLLDELSFDSKKFIHLIRKKKLFFIQLLLRFSLPNFYVWKWSIIWK